MKSKIGIIVEVSSEKRCLGKSGENFEQRWLNEPDGHDTPTSQLGTPQCTDGSRSFLWRQ